MTDIEKRAHDFAIAAVKVYQDVENEKRLKNDNSPHYDLDNLIGTYLEAYDAMETELCEKQNQN